ncbi:hypothetical protein CVT25_005034 [Psilocybe cyanescens]|uniref:Uncharacterized protein n=1 Tax=Psilocybe cyanescens TaxID=93625 RepID=A0A409XJ18_PSICY|nr:hypothetical protein CVT25_005034 [Psilocybe cyanescens]
MESVLDRQYAPMASAKEPSTILNSKKTVTITSAVTTTSLYASIIRATTTATVISTTTITTFLQTGIGFAIDSPPSASPTVAVSSTPDFSPLIEFITLNSSKSTSKSTVTSSRTKALHQTRLGITTSPLYPGSIPPTASAIVSVLPTPTSGANNSGESQYRSSPTGLTGKPHPNLSIIIPIALFIGIVYGISGFMVFRALKRRREKKLLTKITPFANEEHNSFVKYGQAPPMQMYIGGDPR